MGVDENSWEDENGRDDKNDPEDENAREDENGRDDVNGTENENDREDENGGKRHKDSASCRVTACIYTFI